MTELAAQSVHPPPKRLWRNGSFTLMWTSVAASGFGDRVMMLAALALLGGAGADAEAASINAKINFFFFLPYVIFGAAAGWIADRVPRKWLMLFCDEGRAVTLLAAFLMLAEAQGIAVLPEDRKWQVLAILFVVGTFAATFNPARNAIIPQVVRRQDLQPANAMLIAIGIVASMIGIVLAGKIMDPEDLAKVRHGLIAACFLYGISGTFFAFLKLQQQPRAPSQSTEHRSFAQVLRYIAGHRKIATLIGINVLLWGAAMVVTGAVLSLTKLQYGFVEAGMETKERIFRYTILTAAIGVGLLFGAGAIAAIRTRRESGLVIAFGMTMVGVAAVLLSLVTSYTVALVCAFGVGFFGNIVIVSVASLLQSLTPNFIRGRVMGANSMINTVGNVLVNLVIWQMPNADQTIIIATGVLGAGLIAAGCVGGWLHLRTGPQPRGFSNVYWRINRLYVLVWHRLEVRGKHHVPHSGPVILASNHTTGIDAPVIQAHCLRTVRWLMLESYRMRFAEPLWRTIRPVFLDKGSSDLNKLRELVAVLKEGDVIGLFPEGVLQRERRVLAPLKPGVGMIARRSHAAIVPVWIADTPKTRSMLWHFLRPSRSKVLFGPAFTPGKEMSVDEVVAELHRRLTALAILAQDMGSDAPIPAALQAPAQAN